MANPKGNPQNLKSYRPKWKSGKTQTIRVPIVIAPLVLEAAREIDNNHNISLTQVIDKNKPDKNIKTQLFTVTSDRQEIYKALEEAIAIPSNRGGQIKKAIAAIGKLIGFDIQKTSKGWTITDTSKS